MIDLFRVAGDAPSDVPIEPSPAPTGVITSDEIEPPREITNTGKLVNASLVLQRAMSPIRLPPTVRGHYHNSVHLRKAYGALCVSDSGNFGEDGAKEYERSLSGLRHELWRSAVRQSDLHRAS